MTKPDPITSIDALRQHYGVVSAAAENKETPRINDAYRQLLEATPFFALASVGPDGLDCSPRGDTGGLIEILGDQTIAIPDRRGNNRLDTLENILFCFLTSSPILPSQNGISRDPRIWSPWRKVGA